ncbi:MAG: hypothetical protein Q9160_006554 [Pyrenula sp. 1 TL-2023]
MDTTPPPSASMGPPLNSSPDMDQMHNSSGVGELKDQNNTHAGGAAAAAAQGPKVVHVKNMLANNFRSMLEDRSISHLISWSSSNESFVMSPSNEFSKVLAQYFKHTNISSFVRQLNMYGFHKVSDVFHTGAPDSTMWEFKHGNGNFKKGDLIGLREIKRRASRHALIHRDSFSSHKPSVSQPGTPAEPMPDTTDVRLMNLETTIYEMHSRLTRTEDSYAIMSSKCQALTEGLSKCHQWGSAFSSILQSAIQDQGNPLFREVSNLQSEIARYLDKAQSIDSSHDSLLSGRQPYFHHMSLDPPLSPHQAALHHPHDLDSQIPSYPSSRRPSAYELSSRPAPNNPSSMSRPPLPAHLAISPRRYGSISGAAPNPPPSAGYPPNRSPLPPSQPVQPHPLSNVSSPPNNLARRHTSADIRSHGWPPNAIDPEAQAAYPPNNIPNAWPPPSSPQRTPVLHPVNNLPPPDPDIHHQLASYQLGGSRRQAPAQSSSYVGSGAARQDTPPLHFNHNSENHASSSVAPNTDSVHNNNNTWSLGGPGRFPRMHLPEFGAGGLGSAPATRRSSMASNVHSLLNPAETAERDEEGEGGGEERKRKRLI